MKSRKGVFADLSVARTKMAIRWALRLAAIAAAIALGVIVTNTGALASQLVLNSTGGAMTIGTDFVVSGAVVANRRCPDGC